MSSNDKRRNYDDDRAKLKTFLAEFHTVDESTGRKDFVYARLLTRVAHREAVAVEVDLEHLREHDPDLAEAAVDNSRRFVQLFSDAIWEMLPDYRERDPPARDALDVYINHRTLMEARTRQPGDPARAAQNQFPPELMRRYEVYLKVPSDQKSLVIRDVKAGCIGKLVNIKGIITRATEVKPMMQVRMFKRCFRRMRVIK